MMRPHPSLPVALRRHATVLLCLAVAAVAWRPTSTTPRRMISGYGGYHSAPLAPASSLSTSSSSPSAKRGWRRFRAVVSSAVEASIDNGADATSAALDDDDVCPTDEDELSTRHAALRSEVSSYDGRYHGTLRAYKKLRKCGGRPDEPTFRGVLCACRDAARSSAADADGAAASAVAAAAAPMPSFSVDRSVSKKAFGDVPGGVAGLALRVVADMLGPESLAPLVHVEPFAVASAGRTASSFKPGAEDTSLLNLAISTCRAAGKPIEALAIIDAMAHAGIERDDSSYGMALEAGNVANARAATVATVIDAAEDAADAVKASAGHTGMNETVLKTAAAALPVKHAKAISLGLLSRMKRDGITPNHGMYASLVPLLQHGRLHTQALAAYYALKSPGVAQRSAAVIAASRAKDMKRLKGLLDDVMLLDNSGARSATDAKAADAIPIEPRALLVALKALAHTRSTATLGLSDFELFQAALACFERLPRPQPPEAFHAAIVACGHAGKGVAALELLERMKRGDDAEDAHGVEVQTSNGPPSYYNDGGGRGFRRAREAAAAKAAKAAATVAAEQAALTGAWAKLTDLESRPGDLGDMELFKKIDVDGSGEVDRAEFKQYLGSAEFTVALAELGVDDLTDSEIDALFRSIDVDGSGEIDYLEFRRALQARRVIAAEAAAATDDSASAEAGGRRRALGAGPSRATYQAALYALQEAGMLNEAQRVLDEMASKGFEMNAVTYNIAINARAQVGDLNGALAIIEAMRAADIAPTAVTFASAINAAAQAANARVALVLLAEMHQLGFDVEERAYAAALQACCREPDASVGAASAATVVETMSDAGMTEKARALVGETAKAALTRQLGAVDPERVAKAEALLGIALTKRQQEV